MNYFPRHEKLAGSCHPVGPDSSLEFEALEETAHHTATLVRRP